MTTTGRSNGLKIGYMPLAHATYWHFFPQHLEPSLKFARELGEYLGQFGTICWTGDLVDSMSRSGKSRLLFQAEDVDVLVLATVTYSTPDDVLLDLKKFPRPVVVWNTQVTSTIVPDLDFDKWMLEHGVTGVPGITNLMVREKMPYFLISGHTNSRSVKDSFAHTFQAISTAKRIWGSRIGMFGHTYPGMIDFGYDPTMMFSKFGVSTVPILESALLSAYKEVDDADAKSLEADLKGKYNLADDFEGREFTNSVRLALAMKQVARDKQLDAATVYCQQMWRNQEIGVVSCVGNSLLAQEGLFCSCEGDIPTALSGMILDSLCGAAVFTEIWCNDFDNDQLMMGHSGQMNLKLFEGDTKSVTMSRHPWWNGCHGRGACLRLKMPTGEATMMGITPTRGGDWRMVVSKANVIDRPPVPLGAPNFFLKMNKPIEDFLLQWGEAGAAHHFAMAYGDWTNQLKALAKILDVQYLYV